MVHLAELSNDPLGENDPDITMEINHRGSVEFAKKCKAAGVARFVYASSCSIYGAAGDEIKSEKSMFAPQTAYARCKVLVERDLRAMVDPTSRRFSCAMQLLSARRPGSGLTSSSTISPASRTRPEKSA